MNLRPLFFIMYRLMLSVLDFSLKAQAGRLDCLILENQENRSMSKIATKAIDCYEMVVSAGIEPAPQEVSVLCSTN